MIELKLYKKTKTEMILRTGISLLDAPPGGVLSNSHCRLCRRRQSKTKTPELKTANAVRTGQRVVSYRPDPEAPPVPAPRPDDNSAIRPTTGDVNHQYNLTTTEHEYLTITDGDGEYMTPINECAYMTPNEGADGTTYDGYLKIISDGNSADSEATMSNYNEYEAVPE